MTVFWTALRTLLAAAFIAAGVLHFVKPAPYLAIMPPWLPAHALLVQLSGVAELAGGVGLLRARWRRAAGIGLIVVLIMILPANIQMLLNYQARGASTGALALLWLRLPVQVVLIWAVWRVSIHPTSCASESVPGR